jgi:hypothetical protein
MRRFRTLRGLFLCWSHQHFQRAALHLFRLARIDEVATGQDDGASGKYFSLPVVREAEVQSGDGHGFAL